MYFKVQIPKELMVSEANNRDHWSVKRKRQNLVNMMLRPHVIIAKDRVKLPCKITMIRVSPRKLDEDNNIFNFKGIRDFIADQLIPDLAPGRADDDRTLLHFDYGQKKGVPKEYAIEIIIQSI
jgi:hypothetical protein